jgi:uncharacterized protein (TIGR02466 family)
MTLNELGSYAVMHDHGSSDISGVYYYKTNEQDGNLFFQTPNKLLSSNFLFKSIPSIVEYTPKVGKIVLFPGWLNHGVHTNTTDNERVSISFNIKLIDYR